ncbi:MAG: putative MPP superfamily phosphohydrolase [Sphingobacteriales bacterium]|jgi:predicted MPP superfamily phosphohydrolase
MTILIIFLIILAFLEFYGYKAIKTTFQTRAALSRKIYKRIYFSLSVISLVSLILTYIYRDEPVYRNFLSSIVLAGVISKLILFIFLFVDDIRRFFVWIFRKIAPEKIQGKPTGRPISRSEFLTTTGTVLATAPLAVMAFGISSGAYDYRVRREKVIIPHLPKSFHGLKIAQISDIHSGSFFNKTAVSGGVDMLLAEKPDVVFFTGDLVNNRALEMQEYVDIFKRIKAPLGVYSTLGNHDYGDYVQWATPELKAANMVHLKEVHAALGWDLLNNENRILEQSGDKIAIIGVENWSNKGRFPKYGDMEIARQNTEDAAVKLLLSHDPSHWEGEILPKYNDIDVMFAGHTHGMQFGIEIGGFQWSPVQYLYKQWAGLYSQNNQHLYVNRGYGFLGFPGRIGMPPEITIFELQQS